MQADLAEKTSATGGIAYLDEANELGLLSEASSGEVQVVLSDESLVASSDSASSGSLSEGSKVRSLLFLEEVVWVGNGVHDGMLNSDLFNNN